MSTPNLWKTFSITAVALLVGAVAGASLLGGATATHQPADKMAVSGSALEIMTLPLVEGMSTTTAVLLQGQLKTSSPTDVILSVNMECALWTDITTIGNSNSEAIARVKVWVEIDGQPVPVSMDDRAEPGKVVFCDRAYQRATSNWDDEDARIDSYLRTRSAHSFDWISLDLGSGVHQVTVKADLTTAVTGMGSAQAAIGKRTLVVEPTKLANDVTI